MARWAYVAVLGVSWLFGLEPLSKEQTTQFLETVALAERGGWQRALGEIKKEFGEWLREKSVSEALALLSPNIVDGDQRDLAALLQRAIANCSELSGEKTAPFVYRYKNYQPPAFAVPKTDLILDVRENHVFVTSTLSIERKSSVKSLALHGKGHSVLSVSVNGVHLPREKYRVTPNELVVLEAPQAETFQVGIVSEIDPFHNSAMQGLYQTGSFLITQCESESARQIFYTLDRPDVLSRITTTLIADANTYPVRISNGNLVEETVLEEGRTKIVWDDPIPKPSYLFACVLGDFGKISDVYITKSGKRVDLDVYVEKTKESRVLYSLEALKKAMQFDEEFFDREYDLQSLKMVAAAGFNMGAMENKGLMIFNERYLLVSQDSGTDADFRAVAGVVAHEYFHNWSGNRVTVRNWFELALKEAFTDFRAMLFDEWLFGKAFIRPKDVMSLRDRQFPEERSELGHPLMVESYVSPIEIYDATTYTKGREVFRTLQNYLDLLIPDGFRRAQNLYFSRYDGQAVTFRELLQAANEILRQEGKPDLEQFERWFDQMGTPKITAQLEFDPKAKKVHLQLTQSCPHPKTGEEQKPFLIPFTYEFLRSDGSVAIPKKTLILTKPSETISFASEEKFIPIFLHDYGAPVILEYPYTMDELALLMQYASDPFSAWEAGQNFNLAAMQETDFSKPASSVRAALEDEKLSPLKKAQLLSMPTLRTMAERWKVFDFPKLQKIRELYIQTIASKCKPALEALLAEYPAPQKYEAITSQMEIRELRSACLYLLSRVDFSYFKEVYASYLRADHFDTQLQSLRILVEGGEDLKVQAIDSFHRRWKNDTSILCHWLAAQARSSRCSVSDVKSLMQAEGFDAKNPNHIRASVQTFASNLARFHDGSEGYQFVVDQIIKVADFNPQISFDLAKQAFLDFDQLPEAQQKLLAAESKRLLAAKLPPEVYELLSRVAKVSRS